MVNDVISCFGISEAPHGGVKASGVGRTHGRFGLEEMVRLKYLDIDRMPGMKKVWWHGYGEIFRAPDGRLSGYAIRARAGDAAARKRCGRQGVLTGKQLWNDSRTELPDFAPEGRMPAVSTYIVHMSRVHCQFTRRFGRPGLGVARLPGTAQDRKMDCGFGVGFRQDVDAASCGNQEVLPIDFHQNLAGQDVEELLRMLVMVSDLG